MCEALKKFENGKKDLVELAKQGFVGVGQQNKDGIYLRMKKGEQVYSFSELASTKGRPVYYPLSN